MTHEEREGVVASSTLLPSRIASYTPKTPPARSLCRLPWRALLPPSALLLRGRGRPTLPYRHLLRTSLRCKPTSLHVTRSAIIVK